MSAGVLEGAPPRPGLGRLAGVELRKAVDTRAGAWLVAAVVALAVLVMVILVLTGDDPASYTDFLAAIGMTVNVLLPIVAILLVTSEWSQRTALTTFALVPRRGRVALAKLLAALALGAAATVAVLLAAAAGTAIEGGEWDVDAAMVGSQLLFQLLGMLIGFAFGLAFMASAPAIVFYFLAPTVLGILGELVSWIGDAAEWIDTGRTFPPLAEGDIAGGDWARLLVSCLVWIGVPLAVGAWRLARREMA